MIYDDENTGQSNHMWAEIRLRTGHQRSFQASIIELLEAKMSPPISIE